MDHLQRVVTQGWPHLALFLIPSFYALGALVKFVDDAFDEGTFSRRVAYVVAPLTAVYWAYVMTASETTSVLLTAIVIGVLVKGKIDNKAFIGAVATIFIVFSILGSWDFAGNQWKLLLFVSLAGVLDEVVNDYVDWCDARSAPIDLRHFLDWSCREPLRKIFSRLTPDSTPATITATVTHTARGSEEMSRIGLIARAILKHRVIMKFAAMLPVLLGIYSPVYFFAFLCWDGGYETVGYISSIRARQLNDMIPAATPES